MALFIVKLPKTLVQRFVDSVICDSRYSGKRGNCRCSMQAECKCVTYFYVCIAMYVAHFILSIAVRGYLLFAEIAGDAQNLRGRAR